MGIDTSATAAGVCIYEDGKVLSESFVNVKLTHSQTMMPMVQNALDCAKLSLPQIDLFAVSNGPGSFTGLRISISAVKGMAFALSKPCIAVSTLEALAYNVLTFEGVICSVMDARCNQVYCALFESDGERITRLRKDDAISLDELKEILKTFEKNVILVGDGADLCYNNLSGAVQGLRLAPPNVRFQHGSSVCMAAADPNRTVLTAEALAPEYLRLPQAQRERNARLAKQAGKEEIQ